MISLRLERDLENKINQLAEIRHTTKTEIIRSALESYLNEASPSLTPYELGKNYFGTAGSGDSDRSSTYKKRLKEKLREKHTH